MSLLDVATYAAPICTMGVLKYVKEQILGLVQGKPHILVEEDEVENCKVGTNTFCQKDFGCVVYQRLPMGAAAARLYRVPPALLASSLLAAVLSKFGIPDLVKCWYCLTK